MTEWRKSSHSGGTGGDCVELAHTGTGFLVRDSKNPHAGHLRFPSTAFCEFLRTLKDDRAATPRRRARRRTASGSTAARTSACESPR
ncbi:MAG: DUF397 domain-containing protein [Saccharothrix sp.]|nr:DUF397 domain-containing protein [Saccharothrix sp.]